MHKMPASNVIFVLCCARSGSTLLRYMLDTHPEITAPPELHLGRLIKSLNWAFFNTSEIPGEHLSPRARRIRAIVQSRSLIEKIMNDYSQRCGKSRWCEKSVASINHAEEIFQVFPDAKFLCLYRDAADVIRSCHCAMNRGDGVYGFEAFVSDSTENPVDGLAEYWIASTSRMLEYEERERLNTHRIKFEDLLTQPDRVLSRIFRFLGVDDLPGISQKTFETPHVVGPGDPTIAKANQINAGVVGKGRQDHGTVLSDSKRRRVNRLLSRLGYTKL